MLAWKNIVVRYKQAYLGIAWAVLKPIMLMAIFTMVRSFIGIDSGNVPYPILTFAALMPWMLFQESASEGVSSVVGNANLIRKIYFPREVFPLTAVVTKIVEFGINLVILAALMAWYGIAPTVQVLWLPVLLLYTLLAALCRLRGRGAQCLLPRRLRRIAGGAVADDVPVAGHLPAASRARKARRPASRGRMVECALPAVHAESLGGNHRQLPAHPAQGPAARLEPCCPV